MPNDFMPKMLSEINDFELVHKSQTYTSQCSDALASSGSHCSVRNLVSWNPSLGEHVVCIKINLKGEKSLSTGVTKTHVH